MYTHYIYVYNFFLTCSIHFIYIIFIQYMKYAFKNVKYIKFGAIYQFPMCVKSQIFA